MDAINAVKGWYEASYEKGGLGAQRRYPNEELLRFMGRNFFTTPKHERDAIQILEIGVGSCANLWMIAREGFKAFGLDLSAEAIRLGQTVLKEWGASAELRQGSMTELPWEAGKFDAVVDVFSSNCLNQSDFKTCLSEVTRILKPGGRFFSYTPGKASDAFQHHRPAKLIDDSTLDGIQRGDSPFCGNNYPFRFVHPDEYKAIVTEAGLDVTYLETVRRSYNGRKETFEHVVLEAVK
jgi:SAM-dependent methyltransferase